MSIIDGLYDISPKNDEDSRIYKYIDSFKEEFEKYKSDLEKVKLSWQIENAEGNELDEIGKIFGDLGKRRGRNDNNYRIFLKSIVSTFSGRGTIPDMRFAINNALLVGDFDVEIDEIYGEIFEEQQNFDGVTEGTIEQTPIEEDTSEIDFYDEIDDVSLTVNFVSGTPTQPSNTNTVNINSITGEWVADASSDYSVTYNHKEMLAYTLTVPEPWEPHSSETIVEIAELTDASVAHLREPVIRDLVDSSIRINATDTINIQLGAGLGSEFLNEDILSELAVKQTLDHNNLDNSTLS